MTREEQLKAAAQMDVVAQQRKAYDLRIGRLLEGLRIELEGALEYENFLRHNPYYTDKNSCERNHRDLNDLYEIVYDLYLPEITYGDESPTVNIAEEGY